MAVLFWSFFFFFFNDPATPEIYTLPHHAALPIWMFPSCREAMPGSQSGQPLTHFVHLQIWFTLTAYVNAGRFTQGIRHCVFNS
ncbi:MAG TPA: hypothetical protein DDY50_00115 [Erwinia persicina]|nr:hypothetical protein [Erwinia persicina]